MRKRAEKHVFQDRHLVAEGPDGGQAVDSLACDHGARVVSLHLQQGFSIGDYCSCKAVDGLAEVRVDRGARRRVQPDVDTAMGHGAHVLAYSCSTGSPHSMGIAAVDRRVLACAQVLEQRPQCSSYVNPLGYVNTLNSAHSAAMPTHSSPRYIKKKSNRKVVRVTTLDTRREAEVRAAFVAD